MRFSGIPALVLALFLLSRFAGEALAQAWVQDRNGYYFKVSADYLFTTEEFDFEGDKQDIFADFQSRSGTWFRGVSFTGYVEYGLTDDFTLVAKLPFSIVTSRETENAGPGFPLRRITRTNGGLSDLTAALRVPVVRKPFALSVQGGVKIPLGYEKEPDNEGPPLGTGELDGEIHIFAGKSLYPLPAYLGAGIGYRVRGGDFNDEILYSAEAGYTVGPVFFKLRFEGLQNTNEPPDLSVSTGDTIVGDQDVFKLSPTVSYVVRGPMSVSAEAFHTLAGKNTVAGTTYSLGLTWSR